MYRHPFTKLLFLILLLGAAPGCTKKADGITGPAGTAGQAGSDGIGIKASPITGYIDLYDTYGDPYPSSPGVTVSLKKGDSLLKTTTDSTGKFSLPALPPGNYDLHVTKPGYDSLQIYVQHSGGDEAKFIGATKLVQTMTTKILGLSITNMNSTSFLLNINYTVDPGTGAVERDFYYYFSHSSNLTSKNYDYATGDGLITNSNQYSEFMLLINLTQNSPRPYNSGDSVYLKTIVTHPFTVNSYYYDYTHNTSVQYPYLGDSAVIGFKMP